MGSCLEKSRAWTNTPAVTPKNSRRFMPDMISHGFIGLNGLKSVESVKSAAYSTPSHKRHLGGHDCHELNIGVERKIRHINDGVSYMLQVEARLHGNRVVRLNDARGHAFGHLRCGVADVDLAACDVVLTAVER